MYSYLPLETILSKISMLDSHTRDSLRGSALARSDTEVSLVQQYYRKPFFHAAIEDTPLTAISKSQIEYITQLTGNLKIVIDIRGS